MLLQELITITQVQTVITVEEDHLAEVVHMAAVAAAALDQLAVAAEEDNYF